ncbi:MAG: hypothetical protein WC480_02285 [Patescibacteria group bacterium]
MVRESGQEYTLTDTRDQAAKDIVGHLPEIARAIIDDRPENINFKKNPDDPQEHEPRWHQWGIITHTQKFLEVYQKEIPQYLEQWGVAPQIDQKLAQQIDGRSKDELLTIAVALHDVGKFKRYFKKKGGRPNYGGHEGRSEDFILHRPQIQSLLRRDCGLTEQQIEYVARCAGLHYELGEARDRVKESDQEYNLAFAASDQCAEICRLIADKFPDFKEEIGVLFLGDSLSKVEPRITAATDAEVEAQTPQIEALVKKQGLDSRLVGAIKQNPTSIAVARRYLEVIRE